jgi:hypothetical protein
MQYETKSKAAVLFASCSVIFAAVTDCVSASEIWHEFQRLTSLDVAANDGYGHSIDIDGDTAIIGADHKSNAELHEGAVYIVEQGTDGKWKERARLTGHDTDFQDYFGSSVAIDGDTAVVGAWGQDNGFGAAYIFKKLADSTWHETAKLMASPRVANQHFSGVAISGDTVIVGSDATSYIFRESDAGTWSQIARLTSNNLARDLFGGSVAISGNTAFVGAFGDPAAGTMTGAVHVFRENSMGDWVRIAKLISNDSRAYDVFGVALDADVGSLIIGAPGKDNGAGAAYLFAEGTTGWRQIGQLTALDREAEDIFGAAVAIKGDIALVGATHNDGDAPNNGAAYVFKRDPNGVWRQLSKLAASDAEPWDDLGESVAIGTGLALVGTVKDYTPLPSGSVYLFHIPEPGVPATTVLADMICGASARYRRRPPRIYSRRRPRHFRQ